MFGRPLLVIGLALIVSSCTKAESKKSEPAPDTAEKVKTPPQDPVTLPDPEVAPEGKIEPVKVDAKGTGGGHVAEKEPVPVKDDKAPEPKPGGGDADSSFALTVEQPSPVAAGGEVILRVRVTPGTGYKMNAEFPTKLTLEPTAGVEIGKTTLVLADAEKFDDNQLVFAVKASPMASGTYTVTGKIKFAVCTDATCDPKKRNVSFAVTGK